MIIYLLSAFVGLFAIWAFFKRPKSPCADLPQHRRPMTKVEGILFLGMNMGFVAIAYLYSLRGYYSTSDHSFYREAAFSSFCGMLCLGAFWLLRRKA